MQLEKNHWEKVFEDFLDMVEFNLVHHVNGWGLYDLQNANLAQIESERFENAEQITERLDSYIEDYYYRDLEEESELYEIRKPPMPYLVKVYGQEVRMRGTLYWLAIRAEQDMNSEFVKTHAHEFDVMEMLYWHLGEIDLNNIKHEEVK